MNIRRILMFSLLAAILCLVGYLVHGYSRYPSLPFKCTTFTRYDLSPEGRKDTLIFNVAHDLRFESNTSGYLLITGTATENNNEMMLKRIITLGNGGAIDSDTFRYHILNVEKSPMDNTPDTVFNQWLDEIIPQSGTLQFDVVKLRQNALLIGSPLSFLFVCKPY